MQEVYAGQANVVSLPVLNKSSGEPITTGTVDFYLIAWDGDNAGKWYKGSTEKWESEESIAGAAAHKARGNWYLSLGAAVWDAGVRYQLYSVDSGGDAIQAPEDVLCRTLPSSTVDHPGGGGTGIITRSEVKTVLGITTTDDDDRIDALIPMAQSFVCEYCNNNFLSDLIYNTNSTFAVVNGGDESDTITDSDEGFVDALFATGTIYIEGSYHNDGHHVVSDVAEGTLTLSTSGAVVDEDTGETFTIYQVFWPRGLKLATAEFIGHCMEKDKHNVSINMPGYSASYPTGIPKHIRQKFNRWRRVKIQ